MAGLESWPDSRDQRATCSAVSVALIVLAIEFSVATCQGKTSNVKGASEEGVSEHRRQRHFLPVATRRNCFSLCQSSHSKTIVIKPVYSVKSFSDCQYSH